MLLLCFQSKCNPSTTTSLQTQFEHIILLISLTRPFDRISLSPAPALGRTFTTAWISFSTLPYLLRSPAAFWFESIQLSEFAGSFGAVGCVSIVCLNVLILLTTKLSYAEIASAATWGDIIAAVWITAAASTPDVWKLRWNELVAPKALFMMEYPDFSEFVSSNHVTVPALCVSLCLLLYDGVCLWTVIASRVGRITANACAECSCK